MIKKHMKIKFILDDELPLNKTIKICSMIIVARAVFNENNKYHAQVISYEKFKKSYIMIELTFLKELRLIRQANKGVRHLSQLVFFK